MKRLITLCLILATSACSSNPNTKAVEQAEAACVSADAPGFAIAAHAGKTELDAYVHDHGLEFALCSLRALYAKAPPASDAGAGSSSASVTTAPPS